MQPGERFLLDVFELKATTDGYRLWAADDAAPVADLSAPPEHYEVCMFRSGLQFRWDELHARGAELISMRTVAGNDVHALRDAPGSARRPYLRDRTAEIAPISDRSGLLTWGGFCVRFALGLPAVRSTVGSTLTHEHLDAYLSQTDGAVEPLAPNLVAEIETLQRRWADETDVRAEPWTM